MQCCVLCKEAEKRLAGNVSLANTSPFLPSIPNLEQTHRTVQVVLKGRARQWKRFEKPKCSALQQTEEGQGHKKQLHWQPTPQ